ncbi:unnamed protein product [Umbelopsis vinacea]
MPKNNDAAMNGGTPSSQRKIIVDLENTTSTNLKRNLTNYARNLPRYDGENWTMSGAVNKELLPAVRQSNWTPLKQLRRSTKEVTDYAQRHEPLSRSSKIYNTLLNKEATEKTSKFS